MTTRDDLIFLFDCDNTLLDNDQVHDDLQAWLERELGSAGSDRYWQLFEELRTELGYADYLGAVQRMRGSAEDGRLLRLSGFLLDYPFAARLYPGALEAVAHCGKFGRTVILSDGDMVFQPHKLRRSGLWDAVDGRVLIYVHKELMLSEMTSRHPARHYVMIDDKLRILAAMKTILGDRLTTVFPRQGHYALDEKANAALPAADLSIGRIAELSAYDFAHLAMEKT